MATVADWPDGARCKRAMTMVDSTECADSLAWRCLKRPTPTSGANDVRPKIACRNAGPGRSAGREAAERCKQLLFT
jgi:hypothetical protein